MRPLRLRRVMGLDGRLNDVVFCPAAHPTSKQGALVFFGGDVQDYPEVMQAHRDYRNYLKYNLENTARMLRHNFPTKHVLVVRPSRIEYKSFSCYDNFVPCNNAGVPEHTPTHSALLHLERLLVSVSNRLKSLPSAELMEAANAMDIPEEIDIDELNSAQLAGSGGVGCAGGGADPPGLKPEPLWWREELTLDKCRLTMVGFSKGCVVLNQLIYEFHYTKTLTPGDERMTRFISRIEDMYWLDGGHAGGKNTWITSRSLLETLSRLGVNVFVHVSPYQVADESRPWIGREERAFSNLLRKLGAKVKRYLHEQPGAPQSLQMHFEVLTTFANPSSPPVASVDSDDES